MTFCSNAVVSVAIFIASFFITAIFIYGCTLNKKNVSVSSTHNNTADNMAMPGFITNERDTPKAFLLNKAICKNLARPFYFFADMEKNSPLEHIALSKNVICESLECAITTINCMPDKWTVYILVSEEDDYKHANASKNDIKILPISENEFKMILEKVVSGRVLRLK